MFGADRLGRVDEGLVRSGLVVSGADQENVMEIGKVEEEDRGGRGGRRRASAGEGRGSGRALPRRSPAD
jgi:hypothetical protein